MSPRRSLGIAAAGVAAAGYIAFLTCIYTGMRDVMRTSGGFCANGGPYVIAHQCSSGDVRLVVFGILGILVCGAVFAAATGWLDGSVLGSGLAMWTALFGALGWNFIDLGLSPPHGMHGSGGWIVSGVVFWLMALGGLAGALALLAGWIRRGGRPEEPEFAVTPLVRANVPGSPGAFT